MSEIDIESQESALILFELHSAYQSKTSTKLKLKIEKMKSKWSHFFMKTHIKTIKWEAPPLGRRFNANIRVVFGVTPTLIGKVLGYKPDLLGYYGYPSNWNRLGNFAKDGLSERFVTKVLDPTYRRFKFNELIA